MPKSAIEAGSGTAPTETVTVPVAPEVTPVSDALENVIGPEVAVVKMNDKVPLAAGPKLASTVFARPPGSAVRVMGPTVELTSKRPATGSTDGE
jgi:hypothetical protein